MGVFDRFERRLERLVEGAFGRVFKGEAVPADIAHALQRETDERRVVVGPGRVIAPNDFVVALGDHDHDRLGPYAEPLGAAFAEMLAEHGREAGYSFAGPLRITLQHDPALDTGRFQIRSDPAAPAPQTAAAAAAPSSPSGQPAAGGPPTMAVPPPTGPVAEPRPTPARHRIVVTRQGPADHSGPAGEDAERTVVITAPVTVLGRSAGADVQLTDPGVSRRHAELHLTGDTVRLLDADSTNGTTVNGDPVTTRQLRSGDRIQVGNSVLIYRTAD